MSTFHCFGCGKRQPIEKRHEPINGAKQPKCTDCVARIKKSMTALGQQTHETSRRRSSRLLKENVSAYIRNIGAYE